MCDVVYGPDVVSTWKDVEVPDVGGSGPGRSDAVRGDGAGGHFFKWFCNG